MFDSKAHLAHIESLKQEVMWLRSCIPWSVHGGEGLRPSTPLELTEAGLAPTMTSMSMSDDEEDVAFMLKNGDIDKEEAEAILKTLGYANTEIELT